MTSTTTTTTTACVSPILTFGKHKGIALAGVPTGYLRWLLDSTVAIRYSLETAVSEELTSRGESAVPRPKKAGAAVVDYSGGSLGGSLSTTDLASLFSTSKTPPGIAPPTTGIGGIGAFAPIRGMGGAYAPIPKPAGVKPTPPSKPKSPKMNCWTLATDVLRSGFHVLLHGGIGLGKTTFALQAGLEGEEPAPQGLTLTDGMTLGDMFGRFWLKNGTSEWIDGPATRALREGSRLVLNEVESASGEIMTALHALTDHPTIARVALPNGEILAPASGFRVVMTSNFVPHESLPAPLVDRAICIEIDSPHPDSVAALPDDLRQTAMSSSISKDAKRRVSMRAWHHYAALRRTLGEGPAAQAVFAGRADDILDAFSIRRGPRDND